MNRYTYVRNNPLNYVDPYGLFSHPDLTPDFVDDALDKGGELANDAYDEGKKFVTKTLPEAGAAGAEAAVHFVTDPYNIASGVQFASLWAMRVGCPTSFSNAVSAAACGLGTIGYIATTYYKWNSNCNKVRQGEYSPLEAKFANIIATGPLPGGVAAMLARSGLKRLAHYVPGGIGGCEPGTAAASSFVGPYESKE